MQQKKLRIINIKSNAEDVFTLEDYCSEEIEINGIIVKEVVTNI